MTQVAVSQKYNRTTYMILCAVFAALTAVCAWIAIPLPFTPVPVVLATMATLLAGGLLGTKYGTLSMVVYLLLGAVGAPVFAGFKSGLGALAGPTGGFLIGYITSAFLCGLLLSKLSKNKLTWGRIFLAATAGLFSCYVLGTAWFMYSTGTGFYASMMMCVVPFLPGEVLKTIAAAFLIKKLRPIVYEN